MSSDMVAGVVVTVLALTAMYLWLAVCEVSRRIVEHRKWRRARQSAAYHYGYQVDKHSDQHWS